MDTPIIKTNIFIHHGLSETFIKDESKNIFGTIKDRRNIEIIKEASRLKVDKLTLITSGNSGYSLSKFASEKSIKVTCIVSKSLPQELKDLLKSTSYQVIESNLDHKILRPEEIISFAREKEEEVIWDVTNGYEVSYKPVVSEIVKKIEPDYIVVPIGSGGIFLGIVEELDQINLKTRVIGVGVQNTTHSFADKLCTPWTPYSKALENHQKNGHHIVYRLSEDEVKKTYSRFKNVVDCEPSSSVVFAAIDKHRFETNDKIVFLNSGKNIITS